MPYQINFERGRYFKKMSPFPQSQRPFTEAVGPTQDIIIEKGTTLPALMRKVFKVENVYSFQGKFGFLDRDDKERVYSPGNDDPFVFRNAGSVAEFGKSALSQIKMLTDMWKEFGLPVTRDKDRQIDEPDTSVMFDSLIKSGPYHDILINNYQSICFIASNVDILKKACVVRNIYPGWWAQSYAGKNAQDLNRFAPALRVFIKAVEFIEKSDRFQQVLKQVQSELGDPLDTSTGYPLFSSETDASGRPIAKDKTIEIFKDLGDHHKNFDSVVKEIGLRCKPLGLQDYPLMISPLRRIQYGYKYNHEFEQTSIGLTTLHDNRGFNSVRVAWMSPYVFNLYLSPLQARWKALRKLLPGMFFDGSAKKNRLDRIRSNKLWLAEADYSNYDRFIPIDLFTAFYTAYLKRFKNQEYWTSMCKYLHKGLPVIWPDYVPNSSGRGWVCFPLYALLSGVKVTAEEGTFTNGFVNIQANLDTGRYNEQSMFEYLTQYVRTNQPVGSMKEDFFLQSDDDLLTADSPEALHKQGTAFKSCSQAAGLKGTLAIGDRFLMRHCFDGRDTPVPARIWQNTLSNEEPYTDALKFKVGIMMRTDGLLGHKTYDPFDTRKRQNTSKVEVRYTLFMLKDLRHYLDSATQRQTDCIAFIDLLIEAAQTMLIGYSDKLESFNKISPDHASRLDSARKEAVRQLADSELKKMANSSFGKKSSAWIYQLHKDKHVPSSATILDQLLASSPDMRKVISNVTDLESTYYRHAMEKVGINRSMILK
jgi:hypothetical protein